MIKIPIAPFENYPSKLQQLIVSVLQSGLDAVDPYQTVMDMTGKSEIISKWNEHLEELVLIAFGKASIPMASAAIEYLGERIHGGIIVTKNLNTEIEFDDRFIVLESGHPVPNQQSMDAGSAIKKIVKEADRNTKFLCLISGGGSSLVIQPENPITLESYMHLNDEMLKCNLPIGAINTIRRSVDEFKGGGLAGWIGEREAEVYILSDIVSGRLDQVASGPTFASKNKYSDALKTISDYSLDKQLPKSVVEYIQKSAAREIDTLPDKNPRIGENIHHVSIGDLNIASLAMSNCAYENSYQTQIHQPWLQVELENGAEILKKEILREIKKGKKSLHIWGGEMTVEMKGSGIGGRNCHLGLLLANKLANIPGFIFISFATDGDDGNSKAAGTIIDGKTYTKIMQRHINLEYYLNNFDSGSLFMKTGNLIMTGPTGTNVNDIFIAIIDPEIGISGD